MDDKKQPVAEEEVQSQSETIPEFLVHDESVNDNGYWIITAGMDIKTRFAKNPVMMCQHDWSDKVPCGTWVNVRVEDGKIYATPKPNEATQLGREIGASILNGSLRACSVGVEPLEWSDEKKYIKQGQWRATVVKSILHEISVVTLPANSNAVAQHSADPSLITLKNSTENDKELPPLLEPNQEEKATKKPLDHSSTKQKQMDQETKNQELEEMKNVQVQALMTLGRTNGHITDENEEDYKEAIADSPKAMLKILSEKKAAPVEPAAKEQPQRKQQNKGRESFTAQLKKHAANSGAGDQPTAPKERESWSHLDWSKKDPKGLEQMRLEQPEQYQALAREMHQPWFDHGTRKPT